MALFLSLQGRRRRAGLPGLPASGGLVFSKDGAFPPVAQETEP